MNAVLEAVRQMALMKNGGEENDLHLRTLEVAQIREDEYFGSLIADDLKGILRDIWSEHRPDTMTADEVSFAENMQKQLMEAVHFEGSSEEKKIRAYLATLGIDYEKRVCFSDWNPQEVQAHEKPNQPARKNDYDPRQGKTEETLKQGRRCGGTRVFIYLHFLFRPVGFCCSKILRLCCSPHHKIRLSCCRKKAFGATLCRTAEYAATPFPRQIEAKV